MLVLLMLLLVLPISPQAHGASRKLIALTFDDGPGPYTDRLLDGLAAKGVKATFFTLGQRAEMYPSQIKRIFAEGHQLCNHSYSHPELTAMGVSGAVNQVATTDKILNRLTGGSENHFLRAPYGSMNSSIRSRLSCPEIFWSVDTLDWMHRDSTYVKNAVINMAFDGAVVLMHDIHSTTVTGVLQAIDTLKARGYELVTVRELFRRRGVSLYNGNTYYQCNPTGKDLGPAAQPKIKIEPGTGGAIVTLTTSSPGAAIYYTLDGSPIGYGSKKYTGPFTLSSPCTIRAVAAYHLNGGRGPVMTYAFTQPPAHKAATAFSEGTIAFSGTDTDETVYYTLDGSDPTLSGIPYTAPFSLEPDTVLSFYTKGKNKLPTAVTTMYYSPNGNLFADVKKGAWYTEDVDAVTSLGLLQGQGNFQFSPGGELSRGMAATLLFRLSGAEEPGETTHTFSDVKEGDYFAKAVEWAYENKIVSGVSETAFQPNRPVNRQELAKLIACYTENWAGISPNEEESSQFVDQEEIADWALPYINTVCGLALMQGNEKGSFDPKGTATRAQGAAVLHRLYQLTN